MGVRFYPPPNWGKERGLSKRLEIEPRKQPVTKKEPVGTLIQDYLAV